MNRNIWVVRGGPQGEHEAKSLREGRTYLTCAPTRGDLTKLSDRKALSDLIRAEGLTSASVFNISAQVWAFVHEIKKRDVIILPRKFQGWLRIGLITGDYQNRPSLPIPFNHWRDVTWTETPFRRTKLDLDLRLSLRSSLGIFRLRRNGAVSRILRILNADPDFKKTKLPAKAGGVSSRMDRETAPR